MNALRPDFKHYIALDGMRGLAALLVVIFHATPFFGQIAPGGYLAVDMFFVLSGFVIEHAYGEKLRSSLCLWSFTKLRLIRFYPLYLMGLAAGIALELLLMKIGAKNAISFEALLPQIAIALVLIPAFFEIDSYPLNIPAWSLFIELLVNIAYGATASRLKNRLLYTIAISSFVLFVAQLQLNESGMPGPHVRDLVTAITRAIFSFTMGVIVYRHRRFFNIDPVWVLLLILLLLVVPIPDDYRRGYDLICIAFALPLLVWIAAGTDARYFRNSMIVLGGISYGVYAIHWPVLWIVRGAAAKLNLSLPLAGIAMLVGLVGVCYLLEKIYDQPLRNWLKRRLLVAY